MSHPHFSTRYRLLAVGSLAVVVFAACAGPDTSANDHKSATATDATSKHLADDSLDICLTGDYRPFSYEDPETHDFTGIDVDLMKDLADELGVDFEFHQTSWPNLMDDFLADCDIAVGGISITDERKEKIAFTDPLLPGGKAAITTCGKEEDFDTLDEINQEDVRVITPEGGTNQQFAEENFDEADIILFDNNTIFDQIVEGKADVMVTDAPEVVWAANEHEELCQVNADDPFTDASLGYMLPKDDELLQDQVEAWLNDIYDNGVWDDAVEKWFGPDSVFSAQNLEDQ